VRSFSWRKVRRVFETKAAPTAEMLRTMRDMDRSTPSDARCRRRDERSLRDPGAAAMPELAGTAVPE
jgi:hypothetical protein